MVVCLKEWQNLSYVVPSAPMVVKTQNPIGIRTCGVVVVKMQNPIGIRRCGVW